MRKRIFPGPVSSEILGKAEKFSATTTMGSRICVSQRRGPFVYDYDGFRFIDFHCDASVNNLGGNHPAIVEAMLSQIVTGNFFSEFHNAPNGPAMELAELLAEKSPVPHPAKVYFGSSGAEANEAALKICRAFRKRRGEQNRQETIFFRNAFHGRTLGILPGTNSKPEVQRDPFLTQWDIEHSAYPPYPTNGLNKEYFQKYFASLDPAKISALFIELPCQGEGGIIPADAKMVEYVYEWTRKNDVLFIADAIQCGMGRTGHLFGCSPGFWAAVEPDIITIGKALGGGLPIGATIFGADLDFEKTGMHSSTFGGGPMVMRVALAAFNEIRALILNCTVSKLEEKMRQTLTGIAQKFPGLITETRGMGAMWAHEFASPETRDRVVEKCERLVEEEDCGVRLLGAGRKAIRFMPPLNIDHETLELGFSLYEKALSTI